jgi:acyl-CoA dehydrogenase
MEESLGQAERAMDELLNNFPNKVLGCLLRVIVFPFGRRHKGPSDKLGAEVAAVIGRAKGDPTLEELLPVATARNRPTTRSAYCNTPAIC